MDFPQLRNIKKALIIKLRSLGDVLLATPVFSVLKKHLPGIQIDAYVYKNAEPLLKGNPYVSQIFTFDQNDKKKNLFSRGISEALFLKKLKKQKYDLVMNLTEGDRGAIAAAVSNAPIRVGLNEDKKRKDVYTHLTKIPGSPRHSTEKNLDYLRRIGIFPKEDEKQLFLPVLEEAKRKMLIELGSKNFQKQDFIIIHPAARWDFKAWPAFRFQRLVHLLVKQGCKLVFTCSSSLLEIKKIDMIVQDLDPKYYLNLAGKISLPELGALIALSKLLITVDSLPLHMASCLKQKTVAIFGPTQEKLWGPWKNPQARILFEDYSCRPCCQEGCGGSKMCECLYNLEEKKVFQAAVKLLSENNSSALVSSFQL